MKVLNPTFIRNFINSIAAHGKPDEGQAGLRRLSKLSLAGFFTLFTFIFMILLGSAGAFTAKAAWPYPTGELTAEGAIVMDADTGTVLYGKNQDVQYHPASITKIMTALVVLENCGLDDKVPVTANAVYGMESGATNAALSVDDILTVEDLLNAMLLRSANDAANALAIYVGGSLSGFADMMNEKADELGCKNTVFKNPSGLTDEEQVTTAYDMALIMKACAQNEDFLEIQSNTSYKLSPTQRYPGGLTVNMEHKMMVAGSGYTDERVIAGKTGYLSTSGNTLVTLAESDGRCLVMTVLKDKTPYHYTDTALLMDFGFDNFQNVVIEDLITVFNIESRLEADKILTINASTDIVASGDAVVTIPNGSSIDDITLDYEYNLSESAPDRSVALINFMLEGRTVGSVYILNDAESSVDIEQQETAVQTAGKVIGLGAAIAVIAGAAASITGGLGLRRISQEKKRRQRFREKRNARLKSMGLSEEDFERYKEELRKKNREKANGY